MSLKDDLEPVARQVAEAQGVEFYWLDCRPAGRRWQVTVFIDKEGGVSLDDCARVSRALGEPLDERIHHSYELEVSSPGIDRALHSAEHFKKAVGLRVQVRLSKPRDGRAILLGKLLGLSRDLHLEAEGQEILIPLAEVASARVA